MSQLHILSEMDDTNFNLDTNCDKYGRALRGLSSGLNELRVRKELCDVVLEVGQRRIDVHRSVLSACSPYFRAMFTNDMMESREGTVALHDLDYKSVQLIIDWAYTARISVTNSNVEALLAASTFLQMTEIQCECCDYLKKHLCVANCLGIREIAYKYSCVDLQDSATNFILDEIKEVVKNEEFLNLTVDRLIEIISSDALNISSERKLYEAVMRWIKHANGKDADRTIHLSNLLQHIRFSLIDPTYLVNVVSVDPLIRANLECLEYVDKAKDFLLLHCCCEIENNVEFMHKTRFRQQKQTISEEKLFVAEYGSRAFHIYDAITNNWTSGIGMKKKRFGFSLVLLNDKLYVLGGCNSSDKYFDTIHYYNLGSGQWIKNLAHLKTPRRDFDAVTLNGFLYVIGGRTGSNELDLVEKYNPIYLTWSECAPLIRRRSHHRVIAFERYIYVLGGKFQGRRVNSVERYDTHLDQWKNVTSMITSRGGFACALYDGYVYVVGGRDESGRAIATCERYHLATDRWEQIPSMRRARYDHGLAELNGLLYAVGGRNHFPLRSVEVYDPAKESWSKRASMSSQCAAVNIASLHRPNKNV